MTLPVKDPVGIKPEAGRYSNAGDVLLTGLPESGYMSPSRACSQTTAAMAAVSARKMRGPNPI